MDVIIIGAGGHGKVVLDVLRAAGVHRPIGFVDANTSLTGAIIGGLPVIGAPNALPRLKTRARGGIVAIGDNATRIEYADVLRDAGFELVNAIHPTASVSPTAQIGKNVVIAACAAVCTEAKIGDSTIINTAAVVDHECQLGEGVHLCPRACLAGRVTVGARGFVGIGANVIQCLSIGEDAIVGAGAAVIADVSPASTVVGVPARVIKFLTKATTSLPYSTFVNA